VLKSAAAGAHKTESGGVALDLREEAEVRAAAERIGFPVLLQPFVRDGAELLAGLVQDPVLGPLVAFGPGGVLAELIGEASFRIAPLTDLDARELVNEGKAGRLVRGFRRAPADAEALTDLVLRLSRLGEDLPEVAELDLNPVLALTDGCVIVDARIRLHARPRHVPHLLPDVRAVVEVARHHPRVLRRTRSARAGSRQLRSGRTPMAAIHDGRRLPKNHERSRHGHQAHA
jgi:hypothetical protein